MKFPVEIVKRIRETCGPKFIIIYRLSMLDLVEGGSNWEEIVQLAQAVEAAGATIINTGIGWHEARVPTIVTSVPRAAFSWVTQKMMSNVSIPLCTTNRINMPHVAEQILQDGHADMVSMARPFLADPDFVNKAAADQSDEINTCIGCNQVSLESCEPRSASGYAGPPCGSERATGSNRAAQNHRIKPQLRPTCSSRSSMRLPPPFVHTSCGLCAHVRAAYLTQMRERAIRSLFALNDRLRTRCSPLCSHRRPPLFTRVYDQACLDHTFKGITASCLVNPKACHEDELISTPTTKKESIAVVGAGPAGLAFATTAAERGHDITLFDQAAEIGGQFNMAKVVPGKEEFFETIRYFGKMIEKHGVDLKLNTRVEAADLVKFDKVIMATGISPRTPPIPGVDHPKVLSYVRDVETRERSEHISLTSEMRDRSVRAKRADLIDELSLYSPCTHTAPPLFTHVCGPRAD